MTTGFQINGVDWDDLYIRRDVFTQGGLWSWGNGTAGALGNSSTIHRSSPVQTTGGGLNWKQVSCGHVGSAAIKTDGTLWTWGYNINGQIGDNTTTDRQSPVQTIVGGQTWNFVSCGYYFVGAIKNDGSLWMWGRNSVGQLGDNSRTNRSSPVQVAGGGTNWKQVSCGHVSSAAIKTDGTLWTWGLNIYGQLGDNSRTHRSSPVQTVAGGNNWRLVSCGYYHAAGIKTDGTLWAWGHNYYGNLGTNDRTNKSSPVQTISGGTNWKMVSCGGYHITAIKTDGTFWSWGGNTYGELGDNSRTHRSSPVQTVAGGTDWKQVSNFNSTVGAIKSDGSLWVWGAGFDIGNLGDGTFNISKSSPVQILNGGYNWKQVAMGLNHNAAIREDYYT